MPLCQNNFTSFDITYTTFGYKSFMVSHLLAVFCISNSSVGWLNPHVRLHTPKLLLKYQSFHGRNHWHHHMPIDCTSISIYYSYLYHYGLMSYTHLSYTMIAYIRSTTPTTIYLTHQFIVITIGMLLDRFFFWLNNSPMFGHLPTIFPPSLPS